MEGGHEENKCLQLKVEGFDPLCSLLVVNIGGWYPLTTVNRTMKEVIHSSVSGKCIISKDHTNNNCTFGNTGGVSRRGR